MNRSSELDTLRAVCNIFVLFCHAWAAFQYVKWTGAEWWGMTWFCASASHMIMPALFFLSGYLLMGNYSLGAYKRKMFSRVKRLLIPYVFWNTFFVAFYLMAAMFVPRLATRVEAFGLSSWGGALCKIIHPLIGPIDGPLYYLRAIFIYSLLSPILWMFIRLRILLPLLVGVFFTFCLLGGAFPVVSGYPLYSVICFALGCWFRAKSVNPVVFFGNVKWAVLGLLGTGIYFIKYLGVESPGGFVNFSENHINLLTNVGYVLGLPLFWSLAQPLDRFLSGRKWFKVLTEAGFFIYASHFLFCSILLHLSAPLMKGIWPGKFVLLIFIFCVPGLLFILSVWYFLKRFCPRVLRCFDGTL